jgi:hypothetical protein
LCAVRSSEQVLPRRPAAIAVFPESCAGFGGTRQRNLCARSRHDAEGRHKLCERVKRKPPSFLGPFCIFTVPRAAPTCGVGPERRAHRFAARRRILAVFSQHFAVFSGRTFALPFADRNPRDGSTTANQLLLDTRAATPRSAPAQRRSNATIAHLYTIVNRRNEPPAATARELKCPQCAPPVRRLTSCGSRPQVFGASCSFGSVKVQWPSTLLNKLAANARARFERMLDRNKTK